MPAMQTSDEDGGAFTVINNEGETHETTAPDDAPLPRNVNVVKPVRRADDQREHFNSACTRLPPPAPAPAAPPGPAPRTILDPKFSRALDFKLRRLKEKEILQANLRRPTRYKPRNGLAASSIPNISCKERVSVVNMSRSHPRIDVIAPPEDASLNMDKTPSPARRARGQLTTRSSLDSDKPRFVTTVKSGQFLLPPPEVATLLGLETLYPPQEREKIVYSYASKPKALASRSKHSPPEPKKEMIPNGVVSSGTGAARRAHPGGIGGALGGVRALVAGVVGLRHLQHAHSTDTQRSGSVTTPAPYSNVMHERRVVRGATFASHPPHAAAVSTQPYNDTSV
ncbi:uncharacterized protein LOC119190693 [Manduca sexta]|uniref:Uncharacterized protein n=1 Tax=Manduca sexta TaxID=7130 RepID=A0A922D0R2_MANSE|nr:uncharacterized protein LOC119190693 [Manduca sexta]KAG6465349.1 hypothetical protein O3G_MSEX015093 [Manduca sexta]